MGWKQQKIKFLCFKNQDKYPILPTDFSIKFVNFLRLEKNPFYNLNKDKLIIDTRSYIPLHPLKKIFVNTL